MNQEKTEMLQPVNDEVRREARSMVRTARYGALAIPGAKDAAPSIARVGLATDTDGMPIFPASSLSDRDERMETDGRASLLVGEPGKGDPLAHGRISLIGSVRRLDEGDHDRARRRYLARHPKAKLYIDFKDFSIWKLEIASASFIAGFGRAYALDRDDLLTACDDWSAWHAMEAGAVEHMNDDHADATRLYATTFCGADDGDWLIAGLDPDGIDMTLGDDHRRYMYDAPLGSANELRAALVKLVRAAREESGDA